MMHSIFDYQQFQSINFVNCFNMYCLDTKKLENSSTVWNKKEIRTKQIWNASFLFSWKHGDWSWLSELCFLMSISLSMFHKFYNISNKQRSFLTIQNMKNKTLLHIFDNNILKFIRFQFKRYVLVMFLLLHVSVNMVSLSYHYYDYIFSLTLKWLQGVLWLNNSLISIDLLCHVAKLYWQMLWREMSMYQCHLHQSMAQR